MQYKRPQSSGRNLASDKPPLGQRGRFAVADNQVVEKPDIDQIEGRFQPSRDALIGLAGFRDARWMIVGKNDRCGIDSKGFLDDFPGIDRRSINRATEQLVKAQDPVAVIQKQAAKQLVVEMPHSCLQKSLRVSRAADYLAAGQRFRVVAAGKLGQRAQHTQPRPSDAGAGQDVSRVGMQQSPQAAKTMQKLNCRLAGSGSATAGTDQRAEQLNVRLLTVGSILHGTILVASGVSLQRINLLGIAGFGRITL